MSRQMKSGPFIDPATYVQVKFLKFFLNNYCPVELDDGLYALVLILPHRCV